MSLFDLSAVPLVWIPIKWNVLRPGEGEGALAETVEVGIEVEVELLGRDELKDLFDDYLGNRADDGVDPGAPKSAETDQPKKSAREVELERFMRLVKRWRKIVDNGEAVEFNEANVKRLMQKAGFVTAFEQSYLAACAGIADIRQGN